MGIIPVPMEKMTILSITILPVLSYNRNIHNNDGLLLKKEKERRWLLLFFQCDLDFSLLIFTRILKVIYFFLTKLKLLPLGK